MECKKCREYIPDGKSFCANCGMQVDKMDEYIEQTHLSMRAHEFTVHYEMVDRAIECFTLAVAGILFPISGLFIDIIDRPAATFALSVIFGVMNIVEGALLLDVRERLDKFRSDAPDYLMKVDIIFGVGTVLCFLLFGLINMDGFGDGLGRYLLAVGVMAVIYAVGIISETVYYSRRRHLFTK